MPTVQINARDLIFEASDMATPTPVWTELGGHTEAAVNYAENEVAEDTTTADDAGKYRQEIMQRGAKLSIKGKALADSTTGAREPGQARLNAHAELLGTASQVDVRMRYPTETQWVKWSATVSRGEEGGGHNAKTGFAYDIVRCGPSTLVPVV